ncbi:MAG: hypothetical protein HZA03_02735 [Nitrospinae bacterium]|nr:hypothetical protein [Nitrospinota bacterium]
MRIRVTTLGAGVMLGLALLLAVGRWHEATSLLHPARGDVSVPADYNPKPRDVFIDTGRGVIHGWFFAVDQNAPTLLYIHGNADTIAKRLPVIKGYIGLGLNVFIYDPHGFGKSEGGGNRFNFVSDAFAAYHLSYGADAAAPARHHPAGAVAGRRTGPAAGQQRGGGGADPRRDVHEHSADGTGHVSRVAGMAAGLRRF